MEGGTIPTNITLYLMLGICIVLFTVNIIEIVKISKVWSHRYSFNPVFFNDCVKVDIIIKTVFTAFSLLASISAMAFLIQMIAFMQTFINKLLNSFLYLNYLVFGLYMMAFCVFGVVKWNDVAYTCDKKDSSVKVMAVGNIFSLIGCCVLSVVIVFGSSVFSIFNMYTNSLLRREEGNSFIRKAFWWFVLRGRNQNDIGNRAYNNNNNHQNGDWNNGNDAVEIQPPIPIPIHNENEQIAYQQGDNDNEEGILLNHEEHPNDNNNH